METDCGCTVARVVMVVVLVVLVALEFYVSINPLTPTVVIWEQL